MSTTTTAKEVIKSYLDQRAATDPQFAVAYAKPNKSLDKCFDYILTQARKNGSAVCMTRDEVFGLAVHYYDEDNLKVGKVPMLSGCVVAAPDVAPAVELTEQEKARARAEAIEEYKRHKPKAPKAKAAPAKPDHIQPVLFDFDEICDPGTN